MDIVAYAVAALAVGAASFFTTVSGFGFALVAIPLLSLVMTAKEAIILVLVLAMLARIVNMCQTWGACDWPTVLTLNLGGLIGTLPGVLALKWLPLRQLELFLGAVLLVVVFLMLRNVYFPVRNKSLGRLAAGFASGFFGAATSVGGPPIVIYCLNEGMEKDLMRANMIWYFGINAFISLGGNYLAGNAAAVRDWQLLAVLLPAMAAGIFLGTRFFKYVNQRLFRYLALGVIFCGALSLLFKS